jgi:hypothetical protein
MAGDAEVEAEAGLVAGVAGAVGAVGAAAPRGAEPAGATGACRGTGAAGTASGVCVPTVWLGVRWLECTGRLLQGCWGHARINM